MPILLVALLALLLPRLTIFLIWLLSTWFNGVFVEPILPILGFLFMPYSLLWYSVVVNSYGGSWGALQIIGLIIAVLMDLSASGWGYRSYHTHTVVHEDEPVL